MFTVKTVNFGVRELILFVNFRNDVISFSGYPPTFKPQFIRHNHQKKMYLMEHQGMQYILAHYKLTDCHCKDLNGPYKMGNDHEEFEVRYVYVLHYK